MFNNKDHEVFCQKGISDIFDTIGNYNIFMQCDSPNKAAFRVLPDGYSFRLCRRDELETWKQVVAEEQYVEYVTEYYKNVYANHESEFFQRCLFVCDKADKPVASTFIWISYGLINTIGWYRVLPEYEGLGIGRALLSKILFDTQYPIYLHTQPTSARAIKLYSDFGFKLVVDPKVGHRKNDLQESLPYLKILLPESDYEKLQFTKANEALLAATDTSEVSEF